MSTRTRLWTIIAPMCALQIAAVGIYLRNRDASGDDSAPVFGQARPPQPRARGTTGVSVHRQRIDAFIAQTGAYPTYEALVGGLNDRVLDGDDIVDAAGMQTSDPIPTMEFAMVLADRRAARLYAMMKDAGPAEASRRAAEVFDEKLKIHEAGLKEYLAIARRYVRGEPIAYGEGVLAGAKCRRNCHALRGALFLCAALCDLQSTLARVDRWEQAVAGVAEALSKPEMKEWPCYRSVRPQGLYLLNLYVFLLERHAGLTPQDVLRRVDMKIEGPKLFRERVPFCAWDAETNPFDATRFHHGAPVDADDALFEVSFARSWKYLIYDEPRREELLRRVRGLLEQVDRDRRGATR